MYEYEFLLYVVEMVYLYFMLNVKKNFGNLLMFIGLCFGLF